MKKIVGRKITAAVLTAALTAGSLAGAPAADAKASPVVKFAKSKYSVDVGSKTTLKVVTKNVKKVKTKTFSSSKKSVVAVSKKGVVTGKKAGTAKIKCKVKFIAKGAKKTSSKTISVKVSVKEAAASPTAAPTSAPNGTETTITGPIDPSEITLKVKWDDTSNIGEERTVSIVGGSASSMTVKDNGSMRKELSSTYLVDNEMGMGVNLGNTLEAVYPLVANEGDDTKYTIDDPVKYDSAWDQPTVTQEYFTKLHSYGINTVRIPVAWTNGDKDDGTYKIDEKLLGRVEEVVNYALNEGMYVVVNDHWDNGWWGEFGACKKQPVLDENGNQITLPSGAVKTEKIADEAMRAEAWKRYEAYWTQIAERFKDYSDHLIFESANEELGPRFNDAIYPNGYNSTNVADDETVGGNLTADEYYDVANKVNQKFVDIFRSSGGNNAYRHLLIAGINTNFDDTMDPRFKMPVDTDENGKNKLILSVHYYTPWDFCGDGGTGSYTQEDRAQMPEYFSSLDRFVEEGYPMIIGECGVVSPKKEGVIQWLNDMFTLSVKYHATPCLWETGQYFDRKTGNMLYKDVADYYNLINGAQGYADMTATTSGAASAAESADVADVTGMTPVWSWTGKWYKNSGANTVGDDKFLENGGTVVDATMGDTLPLFVPESKVEGGDASSIEFNNWGYQAFIKLDVAKYKNPAILFTFLDGTAVEDNVGAAQLGNAASAEYSDELDFAFDKFNGKAIVLSGDLAPSESEPYLSVSFGNQPIVTGIYIYDLG